MASIPPTATPKRTHSKNHNKALYGIFLPSQRKWRKAPDGWEGARTSR